MLAAFIIKNTNKKIYAVRNIYINYVEFVVISSRV